MNIIDQNLSYLTKYDFDTECRGVSIRQEGNKFISYLNLMVNKHSGEMLKISKKVYALPDSLVTVIELRRPMNLNENTSKLELEHLGPIGLELPKKVTLVIEETFKKFNKASS